ncbi:MAG: threonine synthase [candidate division Zixibacteria bacterium]
MSQTNSAAKYLQCPKCQSQFELNTIMNLCPCGGPLLVEYDCDKAAKLLKPSMLTERNPDMWRFQEMLPVQDSLNCINLGEGGTPLIPALNIGRELGLDGLYLKDETVNPTGSFKARGLGMAVSRAKELGIDKVIIPTAGNAGSALAAYSAKAGIKCKIIMPMDVPAPFLVDAVYHGAEIEQVEGSIKDCGLRAAQLVKEENWFSIATLKEPYRIEGKKTMGYELVEHFLFDLPEVVIYPTGGGTGLIGMWKAFDEMEKMGWIGSRRPKMIAVQSEGCAPIPKAFAEGKNSADEWQNPQTLAAGLRVPGAVGDFLILHAVRESNGMAIAVSDESIMTETINLAQREGIFSSPEGGACLAGLKRLLSENFIKRTDRVVIFVTGSGYKYLDILAKHMPQV